MTTLTKPMTTLIFGHTHSKLSANGGKNYRSHRWAAGENDQYDDPDIADNNSLVDKGPGKLVCREKTLLVVGK